MISECCPDINLTHAGANGELDAANTKRLGQYSIMDVIEINGEYSSSRKWRHWDGAKWEYLIFSAIRNTWEVWNNYKA